jgi:hypothetical protein
MIAQFVDRPFIADLASSIGSEAPRLRRLAVPKQTRSSIAFRSVFYRRTEGLIP